MTNPGYFSLSRTVAPTQTPITLIEARDQLRVDTSGSPAVSVEDDLITALIDMATQEIDAGTGWLGRAIAPQTWKLSLSEFPSVIRLPFPPLISITSFTYTDLNEATQTMVEGVDYRIIQETGINAGGACLIPLRLGSWPSALSDFDTVNITFQCGYGTGSPVVADVPEIIKLYIKSVITSQYDNRGVEDNELLNRGGVSKFIRNSLENRRVRDQFYS